MKFSILSSVSYLASLSSAIPYQEYILAPSSRTLYPVSVHNTNGSVTSPESLTSSSGSSLFTNDAATAYDFGINIAGVVTLTIGSVSDANQYIGVTFSESSLWVSNKSCDATADAGKDETLWLKVDGPGRYMAPRDKERGGFRYMTLVHSGTGSVEVTAAEIHYTAMPHWDDDSIGNYSGYFHSNGKTYSADLSVGIRLIRNRRASESYLVRWSVHKPALYHRSESWRCFDTHFSDKFFNLRCHQRYMVQQLYHYKRLICIDRWSKTRQNRMGWR
jgi:hypothetical protein